MATTKKIVIAVVVIFCVLFVIADRAFKRNLRNADFGPLAELFKGRLAEAVTIPALSAQEVQADARLFDTYSKAFRLAEFVLGSGQGDRVPESASELHGLDPALRVDAWGHAFCVAKIADHVAVFSAGPNAVGFLTCDELIGRDKDISSVVPGKLHRYPSGTLMLVLSRDEGDRGEVSATRPQASR